MSTIIGTSGKDLKIGTNQADVIILKGDSDEADAKAGNDEIYGDIISPLEFIAEDVIDTVMVTVTFASDTTLFGNRGNDTIYGDAVSVVFEATSVNSTTKLFNKIVNFGSEEATTEVPNGGIFGGDGKDTLYGDLFSLSITATGGSTFGDQAIIGGDSGGGSNVFNFGDDDIWGGAGSDDIYGDLFALDMTATLGTATLTDAIIGGIFGGDGNDFSFGDDDIWGGAGSDDIYGDLFALNMMADSTTGSIGLVPALIGGAGGSDGNDLNFGDDDIWGGAGSDDIYGDLFALNMMAAGGTAAFDNEAIIGGIGGDGNDFNFGDDDIWGGAGGDNIYGDLFSLNMMTTDEGLIPKNEFTFGDDMLDGGDGNDTLYGDFVEANLVAPLNEATLMTVSDHITIKDTAEGIPGGVPGPDPNTYIFGNDVLTGGKGKDVFSFTLLEAGSGLIMPGNDQIRDFDFKGDTLEFRGVGIDIFDLDAVTDVGLADGDGDGFEDDLLIQFKLGIENAGSIALLDFKTNTTAPELLPTSIVDLEGVINIVEA